MQSINNKKGFLLTIATILLILPLIILISYYSGISETGSHDAIGKMRCDELHYFVEDIKTDMERSVTIFGRRAAIYAIDNIVETGNPLGGYIFNCTSSCGVNCSEFSFDDIGSEAAIAELALCGTLFGENVTYMMNHSIPEWVRRIEEHAVELNFILDLNVSEIKVVPMDAWHFSLIVDYKVRAYDREGMCYYTENIIRAISNTSILGLEDPLYVLQTDGHIIKYIDNCTSELMTDLIAGCSKSGIGEGIASGNSVMYWSNIGNIADLIDYCIDTPQDILGQQILTLDNAGGIVCHSVAWQSCLNASAPKHFAGVIDYFPANTCDDCPGSVPRICDTGEMDSEIPFGGGARQPGCDMVDISNGDCIMIINLNESGCELHQVLLGYNSNETNTSCYVVSDVEENYNAECPSVDHVNGPSFFDRMDGNVNLSEEYVNQSLEYFNNSLIGIETLINLYELKIYNAVYPSIPVYSNATWADYLYWQNIKGCAVTASCEVLGGRLKLDCPHSHKYSVDTSCSNVTECTCPDTICTAGESCPADANTCPHAICYEPTCDNGCGETPIADTEDPGECDFMGIGCAGPACICDSTSTCVTCKLGGDVCILNDECCSRECLPAGKCKSP